MRRHKRLEFVGGHGADARQHHLGVLGDLLGQRVGQQQMLAGTGQRTFSGISDFIKTVRNIWRECDGAVARNGPGRRGPDHDERMLICKIRCSVFQSGYFVCVCIRRFRAKSYLPRLFFGLEININPSALLLKQ